MVQNCSTHKNFKNEYLFLEVDGNLLDTLDYFSKWRMDEKALSSIIYMGDFRENASLPVWSLC